MLRLSDIQDTIKTISDAIASVMNMEVMICDNNLNRIGDSNKEWEPERITFSSYSIMNSILESGRPLTLRHREEHEGCRDCKSYSSCTIKALIGIPLKYNNVVIGAIGIVADSEINRQILIEKEKDILNFINKMADLIISKLLEKDAAYKINVIREQLISIMNSIDDGIIALDENGSIIYQNSHVKKILNQLPRETNKLNVINLIPQDYIKDLVEDGIPFRNRELNIHDKQTTLQALISGKPVKLKDKSIGSILMFKKMSDVFNVVNDVSLNSINTSFDDIIGESQQIKSTKNRAKRIANSQSTILILGESGTGKELFARAIHESSNRKDSPFIPINCAAIPDSLLESELFGYEEGAFTGAKRGGKLGKFQLAEHGTIFLDEIGEMSIYLQAKLLRVLQEKTIEKVGSQNSLPIDVRIIAATNKNLEQMVDNGEFREDLFYRLNVIPISIPPLRERPGDVRILLDYFINVYNHKLYKNIKGFSSEVENILLGYTWKGNVRELQNVVEYAVNMENSTYICMDSIPPKIKAIKKRPSNTNDIITIAAMEEMLIKNTLKLYNPDVEGKRMVAKALGISLATLYRKMKLYNIN